MTKEKPKYLKPKKDTLIRLFTACRDECSYPGCSSRIHDPETGYSLGNVCHISGFDINHHRFNSELTNEERREYNNLIAFCETHHSEVDNSDESKGYTIQYLKELKKQHELGLSNDVVRYVNTPDRWKISKRVGVVSGFISIPLLILSAIFQNKLLGLAVHLPYSRNINNLIISGSMLILGALLVVLLFVYLTFLFSRNETYLFSGLFAKKDEEGNLITYNKFANCIYCNGGRVFLGREKIDNVDKIIGTCNSCMSKYTLEKGDVGRQLPYSIIKINVTQK